MEHPLYGRRQTEITAEEVATLHPRDFIEYTNWLMQVRLNYLLAEGFFELVEEEGKDPLYKSYFKNEGEDVLYTETKVEDMVLESILISLERFI